MYNSKRIIKLYNSKFEVTIVEGADDSYVENIINALLTNNAVKNGDKVTIGKKGIRLNHQPIKFEEGKVIKLDSFQKVHVYQPVAERKQQTLPYRIVGDIAIFKTRQKVPVEFIVDKEDVDKVNQHVWTFHTYRNGDPYMVYRYKALDGSWKTLSLSEHLGYGRNYTHINGNVLDFRKSNMRLKRVNLLKED